MRRERILQKLQTRFNPETLELIDKSELHQSHFKGQKGDETHLALKISASELTKLPLIKAHRLINELLADEFKTGLHAIEIRVLK